MDSVEVLHIAIGFQRQLGGALFAVLKEKLCVQLTPSSQQNGFFVRRFGRVVNCDSPSLCRVNVGTSRVSPWSIEIEVLC